MKRNEARTAVDECAQGGRDMEKATSVESHTYLFLSFSSFREALLGPLRCLSRPSGREQDQAAGTCGLD